GHSLHGPVDRPLAGGLRAAEAALGGERYRRQHGRVPRAEILGAELAAEVLLEVLVDVVGAQWHPAAALAVGQQLRWPTSPAQPRQQAGKALHPLELLPIAPLAPAWVIQVLLAPSRVDAGGLEMPHRIGADPHVLPGRRDGKSADTLDHLRIGNRGAVLVYVA